jgi:hypothetical protein
MPSSQWFEQTDAGSGVSLPLAGEAPPSDVLAGIRFTGRHASYTEADTWYPQWAADGALYSPWTDGTIDTWSSDSKGRLAMVGYARIDGADPLDLTVVPLGTQLNDPYPYEHRYPGPLAVHDGIWYFGTYVLDERNGVNILGPFVGFRISRTAGATWEACPHTPADPIFGESTKLGEPVQLGCPRFVDFGREMESSPDGKAYLVGHGGRPQGRHATWASGDAVYLARVPLTPEAANDPERYEFFAGKPGSAETWTTHHTEAQPIFAWPGKVGPVSMTYSPAHGRYLMWITAGGLGEGTMDSYLLEAPNSSGPWRWVTYLRRFGTQAYFLNFPTRFIAADGLTAWLCYSANHSNRYGGLDLAEDPPGSGYALCLQEVELLGPS